MAKKITDEEIRREKQRRLEEQRRGGSADKDLAYLESRKRELQELRSKLQKVSGQDVMSARRLIVGIEEQLRHYSVLERKARAAKKLEGKLNFDAAYSVNHREEQVLRAYLEEVKKIDEQAERYRKVVYKTGLFSEKKDARGVKVSRYAEAEKFLIGRYLSGGGSIQKLLEAQRQLDKKIAETKKGKVSIVRGALL